MKTYKVTCVFCDDRSVSFDVTGDWASSEEATKVITGGYSKYLLNTDANTNTSLIINLDMTKYVEIKEKTDDTREH